ncbi:MAG: DNA mismatch repair protein MutS [Bacteroidetes bacterium]|nr:DNA mismatch repair protein MutS [Bacteroidota bacterium]
MAQYASIKAKYPDVVLLFRVGDFYETFEEDAKTCSRVLGITLTKRSNGAAGETPLAGFPFHSVDTYLPRLVSAGLRVAICEQLEDPKLTKTLVKRDVVEVVTPGVTFSDKLLDHRSNHYLASLTPGPDRSGLAFCDASTGEFFCYEGTSDQISGILEMLQVKEILIPRRSKLVPSLSYKTVQTERDDWIFTPQFGRDELIRHFKTHSLRAFGLEELPLATASAGAIIHYLYENQKENLGHFRKLAVYHPEAYMVLDGSTKRNLELISSMADGQTFGTLISILDETETPMGARMLKKWLFQPLIQTSPIQARLDSVQAFYENKTLRNEVRALLASIADLERLATKVSMGKITPRELVTLKRSLSELPLLKKTLSDSASAFISDLATPLTLFPELVNRIEQTLVDDPPASITEGGLIRPGFSNDLDEIRAMANDGKAWISRLQQEERDRTGIQSLKINFNSVFGYYIEITKTHLEKVPASYIRKQTMVNAERFITPELKETEEKLLHAETRMNELEQSLFLQLRQEIAQSTEALQQTAHQLATIDCLANFAHIAVRRHYTKPVVNDSDLIDIRDGRHPVIETLLPPGDSYVPNDVILKGTEEQILIITGPNMSGKSSYLRQTGLIVLMAQVGSFVPASSASVGVVDRIFTRVGASDNLAAGESTFLVEMNETANILNHATDRSLILLDEIGRGTSTYDGLSIAWSLCEYLHDHSRARTLFATHYHELNELASTFTRIRNFNVEVREYGDKVIFLRKIIPGGADHSYGIHVAQLAGLPEPLISRARIILRELEEGSFISHQTSSKNPPADGGFQMTLFDVREAPIIEALLKTDVNRLAPVEALLKLNDLISMARAAMKKKRS